MGKIAGWDSLCDDTNALATSTASTINGTASLKYVLLVDENDRIKYLVATIPSYSLTTEEYAVVQNIEFNLNENDEKVYEFTLFANGVTTEPIEISCSFTGIEEGDLVSYKLSDDTISEINKKVEIADIAELEADEQLSTYIAGEANTIGATTTKEALTVDEIFNFFCITCSSLT
jgi:hypothetical protein